MIAAGRQIAAARAWMGWTQSELASRAGLSRGAIHYWEARKAITRRDHAPNSAPTRIIAAFQSADVDLASDPRPSITIGACNG